MSPAGPRLSEPLRQARAAREVVSFVRRSARLGPQQRKAWDSYAARWVLDVPRGDTDTSVDPAYVLDRQAAFGRKAPLVVEIGSGMGGSLVPMARARPQVDVLAFEVYQPALARTLAKLARYEVDNVRLAQVDAVQALTTMLPTGSVDALWVFFPDPWPKVRHHKRRLVTRDFADLAAARLAPGAEWRLATDDEDYAAQMRGLLDRHPAFSSLHPGDWAPRWDERPVTRFEERGLEAGRHIYDLAYRRTPGPAPTEPEAR